MVSSRHGVFKLFTLVAALSACSGSNDPGSEPQPGDFISDHPEVGSSSLDNGAGSGSGGTTAGTGGSGGDPTGAPTEDGDPARAIAEADIIQLEGDRLYALSRYGGLSVIDVSNPSDLELRGRFKSEAEPFEMYLRGDLVLGLFNAWGRYTRTAEGAWQWVQTSEVVALDVSDPANIVSVGQFSVPGYISDSRIVGDVLYVVTYQNGSCWDCAAASPRTVVVSIDLADPTAIRKVDELAFEDTQDERGWGRRSISVTAERMYVSGRTWRTDGSTASTIQVVDISDPSGDLTLGASVEAEGQISSRWQMDELDGVLRVISQPWDWALDTPPSVQTFTVASSQSLTPLGSTSLVLPRPEQLQSVRFDGDRAYAITFERTDPLFTIDLSDPANPAQRGELEIPGWVHHMEPRGDRLFGLGFDPGNTAGGLHVSIFDVSDLSAPTMLDRVNFGGDWVSLAEDQDRIHKAFRILDDQGLILVPYSGWSSDDGQSSCGGNYQSGVQLIDFTLDDLALRGAVESRGEARRAFLHRERLFTVSDDRVQTFDIADKDTPKALDHLALARLVSSTVVSGDQLVRLGADWWTNSAQIDVAPLSRANDPASDGALDLSSALGLTCSSNFYDAQMFAHGSFVYVVYHAYHYDSGGKEASAVAVIDMADPAAPKLVSNTSLEFVATGWYGYDAVVSAGERVVQVGSSLVLLRSEFLYDDQGNLANHRGWIEVIDLSEPESPHTAQLELAQASGLTGLFADGDAVLTSHFEPLSDGTGRVRFFIDRVDLSNPRAPKLTDKVNVPGSLFAWDAARDKAITVDYKTRVVQDVSQDECYARAGYAGVAWIPNDTSEAALTGTCTMTLYSLRLLSVQGSGATLLDTWEVPEEWRLGPAELGDDRLFLPLYPRKGGYFTDCYGCGSRSVIPLLVVGGIEDGALVTSTFDASDDSPYGGYVGQVVAFGQRVAYVNGMGDGVVIADTSDAKKPAYVRTVPVDGYIRQLHGHGDLAIVSSGYDGVQLIDVAE
ncbi:MAG TPA: beta-propeller domain-containing protein [Polyangiaceae bacterium]|nr:beta-propeller domain-containing protein [Polyangiaceae bacterium]